MANVDVIPTAQNLPDGFCPTSWQDTVQAFATAMRVTLPSDYGQIVISDTTPAPADQDKIWFQQDGSGDVVAIRYWDSSPPGSWERIPVTPYYFTDTGAANSLQITTGDAISTLSDLTGRLLIVKVAAASTSATPTLTVDSAGATVIKKDGSADLISGDMTAGMLAILIYDGTQFQLLNPVDPVQSVSAAQFVYQEPSGTPLITISAGTTTIPIATTVQSQPWASLGGGGAVTLQPGTYMITATVAVSEDGSTAGIAGQLVISNGSTDLNWHDFIVNNSGDSNNVTCITILTVAPATTASITSKIYVQPGGGGQYGGSSSSTRTERLASLTIVKFP